ncbi:MAG: hypothetical protein A2X93_08965 [Deltaproteobacteria bacterium GWC2_56_8]|nr:MAG: hypothetical protein A2X99_02055 [Deltaproteobacteria bacterium GWB2_55_19]OGP38860.1 MAG: hypothetical protein A2X93_08965 [Deltaproteobacteria bacterium GWC2_56_8]HAO94065.1 hypothetical protein [Deltaproteobacteria bacterium]
MRHEIKKEIINLIEQQTGFKYPIRWVDEKTTRGDFDGRESSIDVFYIPFSEEDEFLTLIEPIRNRIRELIGNRGLFIFHSPEATDKYYSHLFPITKGIIVENGFIKFPEISETEGSTEIIGARINIKYWKAA